MKTLIENEHIRLAAMIGLLMVTIVLLLQPEHRTWHENGSRYTHQITSR